MQSAAKFQSQQNAVTFKPSFFYCVCFLVHKKSVSYRPVYRNKKMHMKYFPIAMFELRWLFYTKTSNIRQKENDRCSVAFYELI